MPLFRQVFTRAGNPPDLPTLATAIRPTIGDPFYVGVALTGGVLTVNIDKPTTWSGGNITTVQTAVTACADATLQSTAQNEIDEMDIMLKAICLAIIDQLNTLRAFHSLGAITPATAIAAIRAKAATL